MALIPRLAIQPQVSASAPTDSPIRRPSAGQRPVRTGSRPRGLKAPSILAGVVVLLALAAQGAQKVPAQLEAELSLWLEAVRSGEPATIARRLPKNTAIVFKRVGYPGDPEALVLDSQGLRQRLEDGQADPLGLDAGLLLPRARHLKRIKRGRWSATDERCPQVRWIFTFQGARWRLAEVQRHLLKC